MFSNVTKGKRLVGKGALVMTQHDTCVWCSLAIHDLSYAARQMGLWREIELVIIELETHAIMDLVVF